VDPFDDALEQFGRRGPEFGPGLSNHGPMAADALVAMGRGGDVPAWAEWYAGKLEDAPPRGQAIEGDQWREALGDMRRAGDWSAFFERELSEQPWPAVVDLWVGRLAPGLMAGATHGILRTAHAVRSLERGENPARLRELAEGMGYWAARYQRLPTAPRPDMARGTSVRDALAEVVLVEPAARRTGLIFKAVKSVETTDFAPVIDRVDMRVEPREFVTDVTRTFVRQYLANARRDAIAFVHTVTAPSALRILAPHLSEATTRDAMRYAWQACAAIYAAYGGQAVPEIPEQVEFDREDLVEQAVTARDEHAIKFTEACLREHAVSADPAYIVAAQDVVARLRERP